MEIKVRKSKGTERARGVDKQRGGVRERERDKQRERKRQRGRESQRQEGGDIRTEQETKRQIDKEMKLISRQRYSQ